MYHVYWIGADGAVRERVITQSGELNNWASHNSRGLRSVFLYSPRQREWGRLEPTSQWRLVQPDKVPTAIRAYHLITQ